MGIHHYSDCQGKGEEARKDHAAGHTRKKAPSEEGKKTTLKKTSWEAQIDPEPADIPGV